MSGIAVVMSGFPRRSETFALNELAALKGAGVLHAVFATKAGDGLAPHEDALELLPDVTWLSAGDARAQAEEIVHHVRGHEPLAIHGYFAHTPAEVAECAAARLRVPFTFSVHARDARKVGASELRDRARRAAAVVTCNSDAHATLHGLGVQAQLVPHGVNLSRFGFAASQPGAPLRVLAVGRLVPKKGFDVLLRALALARTPWTLDVAGDGPEREALARQASALEISERVRWLGTVTHEQLPQLYRECHVVVVPSVVDGTGDRDGLPNVVLEAMASGRLVIATPVGAIPSAVRDDETGWLVPAGDPNVLSHRIEAVANSSNVVGRLAASGRAYVERHHDGEACARRFVDVVAGCHA